MRNAERHTCSGWRIGEFELLPAPGSPLRLGGFLSALIILASVGLYAQVNISGQASSALIKSDEWPSQYSYNDGRGTFNWRLDLFGDVQVSENIIFRGSMKMYQDQVPRISLFSLSFMNLTSLDFSLDVGEIDLPVGNLGERRYPMKNPFFDLPLMNEHHTTVRIPDYLVSPLDTQYTVSGNGLRLLDRDLYDLGIKFSKSLGPIDLCVALTNGTVSATSVYVHAGLNPDAGFGSIVRAAVTPVTGFTVGGSIANGRISRSQSSGDGQSAYSSGDLRQRLFEGDVDFSFGHCTLYGQVIDNVWESDLTAQNDLHAIGYSVEATVSPVPRLTVSARAGGISFNAIAESLAVNSYYSVYYNGSWDHNVVRLETAIGYRVAREALVKFVYQWNNTIGLLPEPKEQVFVLQTVVSF